MVSKKKVSVESQVRDVRIHLWHDGDRSVGIDGEDAVVEMSVSSPEMLQASVDVLTEAFTTLWDFKSLAQIEFRAGKRFISGPMAVAVALKRYELGR
jgi:hypothetical protein